MAHDVRMLAPGGKKQLTPAVILLVTIALAFIVFIVGSVIAVIVGLASTDWDDDDGDDIGTMSVTTTLERVD